MGVEPVSARGMHSMAGQGKARQGKTGQDRAGQAVALYHAHHQHQHQHHTDDDDVSIRGLQHHYPPGPAGPASRAARALRRSVGCGVVASRAAGWVVCSEEVKIRM